MVVRRTSSVRTVALGASCTGRARLNASYVRSISATMVEAATIRGVSEAVATPRNSETATEKGSVVGGGRRVGSLSARRRRLVQPETVDLL